MIREDVRKYAEERWGKYRKTISCISRNERNGGSPLVESEEMIYCFDDIVKDLFKGEQLPASVDGIAFSSSAIHLFEFKTGFRNKIDLRNMDREKANCEKINAFCDDYWKIFRKNRELEKQELRNSIRMKAAETYTVLEKKILPLCIKHEAAEIRLILWVIIDTDASEQIEEVMGEVACKTPVENEHMKLRRAIERFQRHKDADGNDYYYDEIRVMPVTLFKKKLEAGLG